MKNLLIIKIGGNIIDDEIKLKKFLNEFSKINSSKILIHGGGKLATELSGKLGLETKMIDGRRITDAETLKITTMVYAGWINKSISALLNSNKEKAIGLCGADVSIIPATKRKKRKIDYGFVGDVLGNKINSKFIKSLLKQNIIPVIAPITATSKGQLLNTNADTIASSLAIVMAKKFNVKLIYCFEKDGVLNNKKTIKFINPKSYKAMKEKNIITEGMIPKLDNAFTALNKGVKNIVIGNAAKLKHIIQFNGGTNIANK